MKRVTMIEAMLGIIVVLLLAYLSISSARAETPFCYPGLGAINFEVATIPPSYAGWLQSPDAAQIFTWYCDRKYYYFGYYFPGWKKNLVPDWMQKATAFMSGSKVEKDAVIIEFVKAPNFTADDPVYGPLYEPALLQLRASKPPEIFWEVNRSGSATTRPVYTLNTNGSRNTTAVRNETITKGELCGCLTKVIEESGGVYCSVSGLTNAFAPTSVLPENRLALCVRR